MLLTEKQAAGAMSGGAYRIVMIGAKRGERDYVDHVFEDGMPCLGGSDPSYAGLFHKDCAERVADNLRRNWLGSLHSRVEVEPVADDSTEGHP